jgi:hypothetical protein
LKSLNGLDVNPKKMMLHQGDTKVLLLNDYEDTKALLMDLATGTVVDEFVKKRILIFYPKL